MLLSVKWHQIDSDIISYIPKYGTSGTLISAASPENDLSTAFYALKESLEDLNRWSNLLIKKTPHRIDDSLMYFSFPLTEVLSIWVIQVSIQV